MKIAYVHTGLWPSNSPSFTFVTYNTNAIAQEFEKCYLFVKDNSKKNTDQIISEKLNLTVSDNLEINRVSYSKFLNTNYFYYRKVYKNLFELIKQNKIDVIVTRNPTFIKYLVKLKNKFNVKVYFESHDFYADLSLRNDINVSKKKHIEKIENKYFPNLTGVLCLQNSQIELYKQKFPEVKFYLARTGLQFIKNEKHEYKYVAYIGSLDPHKGIDQLLSALNKSQTKPQLLLIGGKTNLEIDQIKKIVQEKYDLSKVNVTGWIDKKSLRDYLLNTALGIIPLTETFFNKFITSPLKLFDYYSYCIPVLATDLPTTRELIIENETGFFFKNGDVEELAKKIDFIFSDDVTIDKMRNNIYQYAQKFLWSERAKVLRNIFEQSVN
ncbi:MAG: glycosyltransferase [Ignavibacteriales bacterium]|nr:glycosyltransferase [Ignavibacteriales bacterium]